jgi:nitric oxide reductase NorD protein
MAFDPLSLMEPEETVGNLWHDMANGFGAQVTYPDAAVTLAKVRPSLTMLFRALGGPAGVELVEAPTVPSCHRMPMQRKLGTAHEKEQRAQYDGERLRLPPEMNIFADPALNRAAYLWLTALAALSDAADFPNGITEPQGISGQATDWLQVELNKTAAERAVVACPGLRRAYPAMCAASLARRPSHPLPVAEAVVEQAIRDQLSGTDPAEPVQSEPRGYMPFAPVPIWLVFARAGQGGLASDSATEANAPPATATVTTRKMGLRKDASEADRKDSFIMHRFESILSWVESMNINRSVDDDDDENAAKAAEDQNNITLSKNSRRTATRLRLHLDLSPADADHERLAGTFTYPEWNHRARAYMPDHCRVLEAPAQQSDGDAFVPNAKRMAAVRRQFEALHPRRVIRPRQLDGSELDLDAVIAARVALLATGQGSDRIYQDARQIERDLSVAFLLDTSRSTEAAVGDTCVIDVARDALCALAGGIDAVGDRFGIWGFSSLRRDRVFVTRAKGFDTPYSAQVTNDICALRPGHYTRLGAAIRHVSAQLAKESATRKLLIVLTDGKPNDLDHYEGQHGIEDSHMALREARRGGHHVHGIVVDEDGQDWFARIFGRGGFTLLPQPDRLIRALPEIYRSLTQET